MTTYVLTLTQEQLNVVATGLSELPFKVSQPVIADIQNQIMNASKTAADENNDSTAK